MNKTCIIIAGPTAVGKTATAIKIANHYSAEIISSDSRQCYSELNIGVAKPSPKQLASIRHHFISSHSIHQNLTAAHFENFALETAKNLFEKSDIIVMVGGTGLYIKAFCDGLDDIPSASQLYRDELSAEYKKNGFAWLADEVAKTDPEFYRYGEMQNPHRILRALEVMHVSGRSILTFHTAQKKKRDFDIIKIGLEIPRAALYSNIDARTGCMMDDGLLEEVKTLESWKHLIPLQTVGYRELFSHLAGEMPLQNAVDLIRKNTRHYAKRQMTWFKKDKGFEWMEPGAFSEITRHIDKKNLSALNKAEEAS